MSTYEKHPALKALKLGETTDYSSHYTPELLQAVPRNINRHDLGLSDKLPFAGCDVWHAYEVSWLNSKSKPVVALLRCTVNANTCNIIESKSFKLYLNSLNQTCFDSQNDVITALTKDLSKTVNGEIKIELFSPDDTQTFAVTTLPGDCIDNIDIEINDFTLDATLLKTESGSTEETLHSHLLKSNCLITNQPDWASIVIEYSGNKINRESLLRYLISFREHNEFHEQCVERIFMDIQEHCAPEKLSVQALYTRRGGLDINPYRSSEPMTTIPIRRINRQ